MSLDTSKLFLQFQILDLTTVSGGGGPAVIGNPLEVGTDDTTKGALYLYGDGAASADGGEVRIYNAADHDASINYWTLMSNSDEFQIGADAGAKTDIIALDYQGGGAYDCNIGADVTLVVKEGRLNVGIDDTRQGILYLYGGSGSNGGGGIYMYPDADDDAVTQFYRFHVIGDGLTMGPDDHLAAFNMDVAGHIFPGASGTYNIGTASLPYNAIYADDVYVKGSSLHIGDNVTLGEGSSDLTLNTDLRLTGTSPTIKATGTTTFLYIDMPDPGKGDGNLIIRDYLENSALQVQASGNITLYGDRMSLGGGTGTFTLYKGGSTAIIVECGGDLASFSYYDGHHDLWSLTASQGQPFGERYADQYLSGSLDVARDITASGTIGWDTVQLSEYNNADLSINSDIRLTVTDPVIEVVNAGSGEGDLSIKLPTSNKGTQWFKIIDSADAQKFGISADDGKIYPQNNIDFINVGGDVELIADASYDIGLRMGDAAGVNRINFNDVTGTNTVAWVDSLGNASFTSISGSMSGRDTVVSGVDNHTVTFASNFGDTDYTVNVSLANFVDTPPSLYSSIITSTTVSGFSVLFSGDIDSSNYVVNYIVTHD